MSGNAALGWRWAGRLTAASAIAAGLLLSAAAHAQPSDPATLVTVTTIDGPITPVVRDHLADTIDAAATDGDSAVVIRLNTPGGGLDVTRDIVHTLLTAPLPIIVYVAPAGADAGSAGTFITYAAHLAYMAPGTTIGAATPVDLEGTEVAGKVVENTVAFGQAIAEQRGRNAVFIERAVRDGEATIAEDALDAGAIDGVAADLPAVLDDAHGRVVTIDGGSRRLATADAELQERPLAGARRLLQLLANPNIAFLFLSLGTLAIVYEFATPGLGLGGAAGAIMLVLAMFSLSVLPVAVAGIALLVVAAAMFLAELFAPGVGVGAAGGTAALVLGSLLLFPAATGIRVDLWLIVPTALAMFALVVAAGVFVARARGHPSTAASDYLIGRDITVHRVDDGRASAHVDGATWRVVADQPDRTLRVGDRVRVIGRDNLELRVAPRGRDDDTPATTPKE
ncbi:MAG: NfeD family protein [Nitriliruptoraceae bacterium]